VGEIALNQVGEKSNQFLPWVRGKKWSDEQQRGLSHIFHAVSVRLRPPFQRINELPVTAGKQTHVVQAAPERDDLTLGAFASGLCEWFFRHG
jgi:hypothetical protein